WSVTVGLLISIVLLVGMTLSPTVRAAVLQPVAGTYLERTIDSRLAAWQEALPLIQDYPLTGSGLGSTAMVLASYVYLLHVPYLYHAHSLYLQVAVEQGLPGLIGWVGMSLSALGLGVLWLHEGTQQGRLCAAGALAAQIALLIYGATDAELYVGIFVPFLFLPAALLFACAPHGILPTTEEAPGSLVGGTESAGQQRVATHGRRRQQSMGALLPLLGLLVLLMGPGGESRWLANQSAIGQTRQELARYEWPLWPLQDALRRSDEIDTEHWVAQYEAILQRDPTNVTALRRLGQIALSQGDYAHDDRLLSAAYRLAPQQRATRQLLGEVKALLGNPTEAAALWQNLDLSQGQPDLRLWWYEHADGAAAAQPFADFLKHRQSLH
ncbi:MAG: O-antigen ligase family protein, partial [Caldilineaceae bacterium]|nr:O-antigen ligase family protein [Caldilineaceae bacterium]